MSRSVECFLLERVDLARSSLRRYVDSATAKCPLPHGYHDAKVVIADVEPFVSRFEGSGYDDVPHDDPRWPVACACGQAFAPGDHWQHNLDRLYRDPRDGKLYTTREAPAGAMWFCDWYAKEQGYKGPDGRALVVKLPDGTEWLVDGPATNSKTPWSRTGEPPMVTARPSILTHGYHGFLTNGRLEEC